MIHPIPPEAFEALVQAYAERLAGNNAGYVVLRVDGAQDRTPAWKVVVGEMVVASSDPRSRTPRS